MGSVARSKSPCHCRDSNSGYSACSPGTILTEVPRLLIVADTDEIITCSYHNAGKHHHVKITNRSFENVTNFKH